MTEENYRRRVIPSRNVRKEDVPVLVECHANPDGRSDTIAVVPLTSDSTIHGFEIRCQCGASVIVECIYQEEEGT